MAKKESDITPKTNFLSDKKLARDKIDALSSQLRLKERETISKGAKNTCFSTGVNSNAISGTHQDKQKHLIKLQKHNQDKVDSSENFFSLKVSSDSPSQ